MLLLTAMLLLSASVTAYHAPIARHARSSRSVVMSATDDLLLGAALQVRQLEQSVTTAKFQAALAPTAAPSIAPSAEVTAASASFLPTLPTLPDWMPSLPLPSVPQEVADAAASFVSSLPLPSLPPLPPLPSVPPEVADAAASLLPSLPTPPAELATLVANDPLFGTALTAKAAALQLGAFALAGLGAAIAGAETDGKAPYEPGTTTYSPRAADDFFAERPLLVAKRLLSLSYLTASFTTGLLWDWLVLGKLLKDDEFKALKAAEPERAKEALRLCEVLGPTFIKLGQALSIRTDLVPEAYALELRQLQDAVPPFDSTVAKGIIAQELGAPSGDAAGLGSIFKRLSGEPLAAASIGQVYKGELPDGRQVAVKVQRPNILDDIALDLFLLRLLTPLQTRVSNAARGVPTYPDDIQLATDLVDEWCAPPRNSAQFGAIL